MAIQFRRGAFADFIKSKMVAGEPAVVQSGDTNTQNGKAFYICYTPGSVDRVLTEQDKTALDSQISDIEDDLAAAEQAIENVRQSIPAVDATLTTTGAAADAKKTGDEISDLKSDLEQIAPGAWPEEAKEALLACFARVAWIDEHGQDYYDALAEALNAEPIPAFSYGVYTPESVVNGKYIDANGDIQTGTGSFYIEDYIPVIRSDYWIGMNPSSLRVPAPGTTPTNESNWRISEYDVSKNFIKQTHFDSSNDLCSSVLFDFDSSTKYMRLGWYDTNASTNDKEFDIENPAVITVLPVEIGNIDVSTGQNSESTTRVRTAGYIPVSNTITITGCPFYDSWSSWISLWTTAGYSVDSFFYIVRCYDSSKTFLGTLTYNNVGTINQDINNVALPSGTAYIRMLFQTEIHAALSITCVNHLITINGTKYYMEAAS